MKGTGLTDKMIWKDLTLNSKVVDFVYHIT